MEYFDENPCSVVLRESLDASATMAAPSERTEARNRALGVAIEASYTVGEYDILILSAQQSDGLETWLTENGYRIPAGTSAVLGSYIRQNMRFFVARVNLEEQSALGYSSLRPLQISYESPKFLLPIRLGMVNADGPQDLFVYALTRQGRVETTNYRTVKLPSDVEVPLFLKNGEEFGDFYQAMFERSVEQENRRGVFLEYAWDMAGAIHARRRHQPTMRCDSSAFSGSNRATDRAGRAQSTSFSHDYMCDTTANTSRTISGFRKPAIGQIFRAATS